MSNIFFSSDLHFHHRNIMSFCPTTRLGNSIDEMNELLIQKYNSRVSNNDTVYLLGDISFGTFEQTKDTISRLNGTKHLIYGNHDQVIRKHQELQNLFESVQDYKRIRIGKTTVILCHFPFRSWDMRHHGSFHLFGHTHGKLDEYPLGRSMDVGIDARPDGDMLPWSWEDIKPVLIQREI